jgi:hypothetical protein
MSIANVLWIVVIVLIIVLFIHEGTRRNRNGA